MLYIILTYDTFLKKVQGRAWSNKPAPMHMVTGDRSTMTFAPGEPAKIANALSDAEIEEVRTSAHWEKSDPAYGYLGKVQGGRLVVSARVLISEEVLDAWFAAA